MGGWAGGSRQLAGTHRALGAIKVRIPIIITISDNNANHDDNNNNILVVIQIVASSFCAGAIGLVHRACNRRGRSVKQQTQ